MSPVKDDPERGSLNTMTFRRFWTSVFVGGVRIEGLSGSTKNRMKAKDKIFARKTKNRNLNRAILEPCPISQRPEENMQVVSVSWPELPAFQIIYAAA